MGFQVVSPQEFYASLGVPDPTPVTLGEFDALVARVDALANRVDTISNTVLSLVRLAELRASHNA